MQVEDRMEITMSWIMIAILHCCAKPQEVKMGYFPSEVSCDVAAQHMHELNDSNAYVCRRSAIVLPTR